MLRALIGPQRELNSFGVECYLQVEAEIWPESLGGPKRKLWIILDVASHWIQA